MREAELRERSAELALAETRIRAEGIAQEQLAREAELERVRVERRAEAERAVNRQVGTLIRRGGDATDDTKGAK